MVRKFALVAHIALKSRGLFSRFFVDKMIQLETLNSSMSLCDRLDSACTFVRDHVQKRKGFLDTWQGRRAQLAAIAYHNVDDDGIEESRPAKRPRLDAGAKSMHLHFANLVDEKITDVDVARGMLMVGSFEWVPLCSFSDIHDDLLLYLSILGAKNSATYQTRSQIMSTRAVFQENESFPLHASMKALAADGPMHENMVAQAIFSASHRKGVAGTSLNDFFCDLLGEFRTDTWTSVTLRDTNGGTITPSDLCEGYAERVKAMATRAVPFLAPPNIAWPNFMRSANTQGCRLGHVTRPPNSERVDLVVREWPARGRHEGRLVFLGECKHRSGNTGASELAGIVDGLSQKWRHWAVVFVFCAHLGEFRWQRKPDTIGFVKVDAKDAIGQVMQLYRPAKKADRKHLVVIVETGPVGKIQRAPVRD